MANASLLAAVEGITGRGVDALHALTGGISNLTYLARLAPPGEPKAVVARVFAERERARTEAAALRVLAGHDVPAPRLVGEARIPGSGWLVVATRVAGSPTSRPDDQSWLEGIAASLAAIHRITRHGRRLQVDPGPARTWIDAPPPSELGPTAEVLWPAIARRRNELTADREVLVHMDFHSGNVHWARGQVTGVIDWEMARWGPPAADVAYCYLDLTLGAGRRAAASFLDAYARHGGEVDGFDAWLLLAMLRPLPDPAVWLTSYAGSGWVGLTPTLLRRRLAAVIRSVV